MRAAPEVQEDRRTQAGAWWASVRLWLRRGLRRMLVLAAPRAPRALASRSPASAPTHPLATRAPAPNQSASEAATLAASCRMKLAHHSQSLLDVVHHWQSLRNVVHPHHTASAAPALQGFGIPPRCTSRYHRY